jgi:uncharacterized protein (TIGR00369 family)
VKPLPHTKSCFVCGESNPLGLQLRFETDGKIARSRFCPRPEHIGFKGTVHGGIIATLLDETMVWAVAVQRRRFAYSAELNIRYLQPIRPGDGVIAEAELVADRRGRLFETRGELRSSTGIVLATAMGKYLPIKGEIPPDQMTDFVGDLSFFAGGK